jgi:flagellar protein FliO/FliZ
VKKAVAVLLTLIPTIANAEGAAVQEFSFISSFIQMVAALSIVVGLILVARHFSAKLIENAGVPRFASRNIRLIETRVVGPKKVLLLIEVGGEYLLLSSTENNLTLIKQIDMLEEVEVLEEPAGRCSSVSEYFRKLIARLRG